MDDPDPRGPAPSSGLARLAGRPWLWAALVALALAAPIARSVLRPLPPEPPVLATLPPFTLTDQDGRPFRPADLRGKVWVANFFFTTCGQSCPRLMRQVERVQRRLRGTADATRLVSFSVDPEVDTPERLRAYGERFHRDPRRWLYVTGPLGELERAVVQGFRVAMGRPEGARGSGFFDIAHGNHLVLVDAAGRIRGYYPSDDEGVDRLLHDVARLING